MNKNTYIVVFIFLFVFFNTNHANAFVVLQDTLKKDTIPKKYEPSKRPIINPKYRFGDPFAHKNSRSNFYLKDPTKLNLKVNFHPDADTTNGKDLVDYSLGENMGDYKFRPNTQMSFKEYDKFTNSQLNKEYFQERAAGLDGESAVSSRRLIPKIYISPIFDRIFGGSYIDLQPNGSITLDFGGRFQRVDNPALTRRQQRNGSFNFDQQMSMNAVGKIGEKLAVTANFDNNSTFDFQNNFKVEYTGYEEDIIKKIELGTVSMPVSNSLMSGAQSLFGIKSELQFGKLWITTLLSQQRGKSETVNIEGGTGGAQGKKFQIQASNYDENRHFFLGQFFRDNYEKWMSTLPQITSGVVIRRVEVYVINSNKNTQTTRNIVGLMDLGESATIYSKSVNPVSSGQLPTSNNANDLFKKLTERSVDNVDQFLKSNFSTFESQKDYLKITTARKLDPKEYTFNEQLGYVSLQRQLSNNEMLAVAYEYAYNRKVYKVGELTDDYQNRSDKEVIYLKLLKPNQVNPELPTWDLMMKNIYSLNTSQLEQDGFELKVYYKDDATGQDNPSLHEGVKLKDIPLVQIVGLDRLNRNNDRQSDGNFDFIENKTIYPSTGNIVFPVLEPFGNTLKSKFNPKSEVNLIEKYVFNDLYEKTKIDAEQNNTQNKFYIIGKYSSGSSNEIRLPGLNVAEGSVKVMAGNTLLAEGVDYRVDYNLGVVQILNEGIASSGKNISVSFEKADLFNFQTRTLTGARAEYRFNDKTNFGGTVLHLNERQGGISRYAVGREPTSNTKYGFDFNYQDKSRLLTRIVDAIPLISTKAPSSVTVNAEFAQILPGTSNIVNGEGTSYLDDFENAISPNRIGGWGGWRLASTPHSEGFPEAKKRDLSFNYRKAKIAWYTVDNSIFYNRGSRYRPKNISADDFKNHYERPVLPQEIYKQRDANLINQNESLFDIAYFPEERGQYNYNPKAVNNILPNPENNWAGITRAITNEVNFDRNNVEYIEFWLLDPFISGENGKVLDGRLNENNTTGGTLVFNLGNVSEDLAPDEKHAFENGLPTNDTENLDLSTWGKITNKQYLTDFFDNSANAREKQDVGLDGLNDEEESQLASQFSSSNDPSADNFKYFLDKEYDELNAKIVQRYKNWNGMDGNSQINSGDGDFIPSSSNQPDNEDLNKDNTISTLEEYFEYKIPLQYEPKAEGGNMKINDFIVDKVEGNSKEAVWYLFRIPIRNKNIRTEVGSPKLSDIKFIRMYLTGWKQPVVLRMSKFQTVASQWRKYEKPLNESGLNYIPNENGDFLVSVVNVEENSTRTTGGSPYVLPPGVKRDVDNTTARNRRFNEQSLRVCVEDLEDKNAKAVYKNVNYDLINYGRIKMFMHAEAYKEGQVADGDLTGFLRFGTDENDNYYEIEIPLTVTPNDVQGTGEELQRKVWPLENEFDFSLSELLATKAKRNRNSGGKDKVDLRIPFSSLGSDKKHKFTIKGNPDLSAVKVMMIGVRNPEDPARQPKSFCVWTNELRVTDFDRNAGWAANARISTQLADLATVSASTKYTSIGFGGIQQKISERSREETFQYDVTANISLGKFLKPEKTGISIPMFVSYDESVSTPKFDPLDPDLTLEATLQSIDSAEKRNEYKKLVQDRSVSRSLNFSNVSKRKVKEDARKNIYDIENFSFSYSFNDRLSTSAQVQRLYTKNQSGAINYNFSPEPISFEPFKESKIFKSPYLALIKDFNISPLPNNFSVSTNLTRNFKHTQNFNSNLTTEGIDPQYERLFTFARNYNLKWNFTKALNFSYDANANAVIDEPDNLIEGDVNTASERGVIWEQIKKLGRIKNFKQNLSVNYKVPLDKFPLTNWLSLDVGSNVSYSWLSGATDQTRNDDNPISQDLYFGHTIDNNRSTRANARVDLMKLYNKVTFLKNANSAKKSDTVNNIANGFLKFLMMLKSINGSYNLTESTILPGFKKSPFLFGLDSSFASPGWKFILGSQDANIRKVAAQKNWLVKNPTLNTPFKQMKSEKIDLSATIQPFQDFNIQLSMNRQVQNQYQEIFSFDSITNNFGTFTPSRTGSFQLTTVMIKTAFESANKTNRSAAFKQFENNLIKFRQELSDANPYGNYDTISQDVLIPAFFSAYSGIDLKQNKTPFPKIPLPNWRVDYSGLSKIAALQKIFQSVTLSHGYNSSYSLANFTSSLKYGENQLNLNNNILNYPKASVKDESSNRLVPVYIVNQVVVTEQFVPLIGINVKTKNNISARLEYRKSRNLSLNMSNAQVTESKNNDFIMDFGFTKSGLKLPFKFQGKTITLKNDLVFRITASYKDATTYQRKVFGENIITNGTTSLQFRPTMSYQINDRLNLTAYFDRNITTPKGTNSFKRAMTSFGIQLRFGLSQ